jgi:crossover junction endodeoxyribonuclease RusA
MKNPDLVVRLPWPSGLLSPNARPHWSAKARAAKKYRALCSWTIAGAGRVVVPEGARVLVDLTFYGPTLGRYDADNALARMKSGLDGLADALRVDDSRFEITFRKSPPGTKGGYVHLEVTIL